MATQVPSSIWSALGEVIKDKASKKWLLNVAFIAGLFALVYYKFEVPMWMGICATVTVIFYTIVQGYIDSKDI